MAAGLDQFDFGGPGEHLSQRGQQAACNGFDLGLGPRQQAQCRQAHGETIGIGVEAQHRFERGQPDLVEAQRALERVLGEAGDEIGAADDEPGLRATKQFVAAERDEIGTLRQRFGDGRLVRQVPGFEIDQRTAAEIFDKRDAAFASEDRRVPRPELRR